MLIRIQALVICIILFPALVLAACSGSSPTLTAASAEYSDVKDCIDSATYGDTINIPAGTATWESTISLTKDVVIVGAGNTSTVITSSQAASGLQVCNAVGEDVYHYCFIKFVPDETARGRLESMSEGAGIFEVSNIGFNGSSSTTSDGIYIYNSSTVIRRVKIHDNVFENMHRGVDVSGDIFGVVYNNQFNATNMTYPGGRHNESFAAYPFSFGTEDNLYFEDNVANGTTFIAGGGHGGRYSLRYNTFNNHSGVQWIEWHGNQDGGIYSMIGVEVYGNLLNNFYTSGYSIIARGGMALVFNNLQAQASDSKSISMSVREEYPDGSVDHGILSSGGADYIIDTGHTFSATYANGNYNLVISEGTGKGQSKLITGVDVASAKLTVASAWDTVPAEGDGYFVVNNVSAATAATYDNDTIINNTYIWSNINKAGNKMGAVNTQGVGSLIWWIDGLVEDVNYFVEESGFDGTTGVGCGTAAAKDAITECTDGTAFWVPNATDDPTAASCSDLTGYVGANPTYYGKGTLYKCASNSWVQYYQPYDYPHPLRDESTPDLTVTVTNTGSGHSPSHDGARTVQTGGSLTFTSGVYNGWKVTIGGTCGCTTDGCTVTPTENCTIECASSAIQLMPW